MRVFRCDNCTQLLFFKNSKCLNCDSPLGFTPSDLELHALIGPKADLQRCANSHVAVCNWIVETPGEELCRSCRLTTKRPSDDDPSGLVEYAKAELAKRRVLYQLMDIGLPIEEGKLSFELLSSTYSPVTTGHDNGVITVDLAESDDVQRAKRRDQLGEPYRTMLGHFRHELGHYYQGILLTTDEEWARCRELFGDEREDYGAAMDTHYANGAPLNWEENFVSAYATMHPWEDWAETWAHYLHIRDTLQTAGDFGMRVDGPQVTLDREFKAAPQPEVGERGFEEILENWLPLTYALNAVNRSMGRDDLYPFVLPDPVIAKLQFVHQQVHALEAEVVLAPTTVPEPVAYASATVARKRRRLMRLRFRGRGKNAVS